MKLFVRSDAPKLDRLLRVCSGPQQIRYFAWILALAEIPSEFRLTDTETVLEPAALDYSKAVSELSLDILSVFTCVFCGSHMAVSSFLSPVYSDSANTPVHLDGRGTREAHSYRA